MPLKFVFHDVSRQDRPEEAADSRTSMPSTQAGASCASSAGSAPCIPISSFYSPTLPETKGRIPQSAPPILDHIVRTSAPVHHVTRNCDSREDHQTTSTSVLATCSTEAQLLSSQSSTPSAPPVPIHVVMSNNLPMDTSLHSQHNVSNRGQFGNDGCPLKIRSLCRSNAQTVAADAAVSTTQLQATRVFPNPQNIHAVSHLPTDSVSELRQVCLNDLKSRKRIRTETRIQEADLKRSRKEHDLALARTLTMQAGVREALARNAIAEQEQSKRLSEVKDQLKAEKPRPIDRVSQREKEIVWVNISQSVASGPTIAKMLQKKPGTVRAVYNRMKSRERKGLDPLADVPKGARNPKSRKKRMLSDDHVLWAARQMVLDQTLQYKTLAQRLQEKFPELVDKDFRRVAHTLQRYLHNNLGFRVADFMTIPVSRNLPRVIEARFHYAETMAVSKREQYSDAIFIDETPFNVCVHFSKGLSLEGCRPLLPVRNIKMPNLSVIAAVSRTSLVYYECFSGGVNGATYAGFLTRLFEYLESSGKLRPESKQMIIHDNVPMHIAKATVMPVLERWTRKIEVQQLPPYSPFLDPCEEVFGLWKLQFCHIIREIEATDAASLAAEVTMAAGKIDPTTITSAWNHSISFFTECLNRMPVSSRRILDGVHQGDEQEVAILQKYREWGIDLHPHHLGDEVERGTTETEPVEPTECTSSGANEPVAIMLLPGATQDSWHPLHHSKRASIV